MKRSLVLISILAALSVGAVLARATPPSGVAGGTILARGTAAETLVIGTPSTTTVTTRIKIRVGRKVVTKAVKVQVASIKPFMTCGGSSACDTVVQHVTINPGGHTGWHAHPGPTFVAIAQGEGTLYHSDQAGCPGHKFGTSSGFFQPSADVHLLRNEGSTPLVIYAFYVLPPGTANTAIRADQPAPANCPSIP
jgi:mannose-6-phosphate isomerase-like protein (cupin superfamily)